MEQPREIGLGAKQAIRSSLLRVLVGLMLALACAIFGLRLVAAYSDVEELSQSLIAAKADLIEAELERFFTVAQFGIVVARDWGRAGLLPIDDPAASNELLMPFLESNPLVSAVIIADSSGRESMLLREENGWLNKLTSLDERGVVQLVPWSASGERLEERSETEGYDPRMRPWFRGAIESRSDDVVLWTKPYSFYTTQQPGITAALRYEDADGRQSVVAFDVELRSITRFTEQLEVSPRGQALVLDESGLVIGLPKHERLAGPAAMERALLRPAQDLGLPEVSGAVAAWAAAGAEESGSFRYPAEGEAWRAGIRPFELAPGRRLLIAVLVPESDLLGDLVAQRNQFLATIAFGLLLAVGVALLLDRWIRRRVDSVVSQERQVGQYTLEHEIGRGGMGAVYRARHTMLRRPTAIKLLSGEDASAIERFEREVQITSQLSHPNTIAIFDYGRTPDGGFYYAMEHLPGITLHTLVQRFGPVPAARTIAILRQVCGSLAEAHAKGLVHRDVKPQNVMLCERGGRYDVVKVLDFGLVKDLSVAEGGELTEKNAITGSPLFLSPEAVRGSDQVDRRSDLYSLGAVAYWLLAGVNVFEGTSAWKVCLQHMHEDPVPPSRRTDVPIPPDLEAIVMRCLAKSPDDRPSSALELERELAGCADALAWTQDRARDWFQEHAKELEELATARVEIDLDKRPRRLAIDLGDRMAHSHETTQKRITP